MAVLKQRPLKKQIEMQKDIKNSSFFLTNIPHHSNDSTIYPSFLKKMKIHKTYFIITHINTIHIVCSASAIL